MAILAPRADTLAATGDGAYQLPPVIVEGSTGEVLSDDPVLPSTRVQDPEPSGAGNITRGVENTVALPVFESGHPGEFSQFRGLGRSAEDTEADVFGVPVNSPQGGGFNLSTFPDYVWDSYELQLGPSLSHFNPQGVAGRLALFPWTERVLNGPATTPSWRVTQLASSASLYEASVGYVRPGSAAVLLGFSSGDAQGPAGSASAQLKLGDTGARLRFHLIAADIDSVSPGSLSFPTPFAHQILARAIPALDLDAPLGGGVLLKISAYWDETYTRYENPDPLEPSATKDHASAQGIENALLWQEWKLGLTARRVNYSQLDFVAPEEDQFNAQLSRVIALDPSARWTFEPLIQGVGITNQGFYPEGSLGLRWEAEKDRVLFGRATYSRRFASLTDRYYILPGFFTGNPDLQPETDWTGIAGVEFSGLGDGHLKLRLQGFAQYRQDVQVPVGMTVLNSGNASVYSLLVDAAWSPRGWLEFDNSFSWNTSELSTTGSEFPYLPAVLDSLTATVTVNKYLALLTTGRFSSSYASSAEPLPGYFYLDGTLRVRPLGDALSVNLTMENVTDRPIELIRDFPMRGRTFVASATGVF